MKSLLFWRAWSPEDQKSLALSGFALIIATLLAIGSMATSPWPSMELVSNFKDQPVETKAHSVNAGPYSLEIKAVNYVIWESFAGSSLHIHSVAYLGYGILTFAGLITLLSLHSTLRKFYFFTGCGFLFFISSSLRLESLFSGVPPYSLTILLFVIWLLPGLYLQYLKPATSFWKRIQIYFGLTLILFLVIALITDAPEPFVYFSTGFVPLAILATPILLILTAHEIPAIILKIIGKAGKTRNGLRDFLILTSIYLINLVALYLSDLKWFEWTYGIHPLILLIVSGILGFWGIRFQQKQLDGFISAEPYGVYLIASLALISFSAIGFFYVTGNDALFSTFRDLSLYTHIGYGVVFITYIVSNFSTLLLQGIDISKILYQPTVMPFFTYRFGGLVAILAFLFFNIWQRPINDSIGGYYNSLAGYHRLAGEKKLADGYLKIASRYAYHNHHSNILLAEAAILEENTEKTKLYFQNALERRPTVHAYLNLIRLLEKDNKSLESYTYLKDGISKFPNNNYLLNSLGLSNYNLGIKDSAIWYFEQASALGGKAGLAARNNELVLLITERNLKNSDSLIQSIKNEKLTIQSNLLVAANQLNKKIELPLQFPKDSVFQLNHAGWLNNWLINKKGSITETEINSICPYLEHPENQDFAEALHFSLSISAYESGFLNIAIDQMERAIFKGYEKGKYNTILAAWMIGEQAPEVALRFNDFAIQQDFKDADLARAVILAESGKLDESIIAWDTLAKNANSAIRALSNLSKRALGMPSEFYNQLNDEEKYSFCKYRISISDSVAFKNYLSAIPSGDFKVRTIFDRATLLFNSDYVLQAQKTLSQLNSIIVTNEKLYHQIQLLDLRILAALGEIDILEKRLEENFQFDSRESAYKNYIEGLIHFSDTARSGKLFRWIEKNNSFCIDGILAAADFRSSIKSDNIGAYSVLANSLHQNPHSIRLIKGYLKAASRLGMLDFADETILRLREKLPAVEYQKFMASLPQPLN